MPHPSLPLIAFIFASPLMAILAGLGAISLPVVIHLFSRRRYRVVTWAAMRFLLAAQKQTVRRMRLEQYLLLATRMLILLLLVLAMMAVSPWAEAIWARLFPESAVMAASNRRTHKILVIDGSLSMGTKVGEQNCFDQARARAYQVLDNSPGGDGFSVVLMRSPAQPIVPEPSDDARRVADEIRHLRLPHGNSDLGGALRIVKDMVQRSPGKFEAREVYFLTDMQKSTWIGRSGQDVPVLMQQIQEKARVVFVDVGHDGIPNLAVTDLRIGTPLALTHTVTPIIATVHNYGAEEGRQVRVDFLVGKARQTATDPPLEMRVIGQELINVAGGKAGVTVAFSHKFATPGEYALQVRLENDALDLDDSRTIVVTVKDSVPVMLVNGKPATDEYDRATSFLRDALMPSEARHSPSDSPARPKVLSEAQFGDAALGDLAPYDCVFLCDVARLSSAEVRRLETHLRKGGGVVFCMGPRVDLEAYNRLVYRNGDGILPAKLMSLQKTGFERPYMFYASEEDLRQPPLAAFADIVGRLNLLEPRFYQYVRTEQPTGSRAKSRTILSFMQEPMKAGAPAGPEDKPAAGQSVRDPAIIEMPYHRGRVVLINTSVNKDWNNWADRPSLLEMMHEILHFSVSGRLHGHAVQVGEPIEDFLANGTGGLEVSIVTPDGRTVRSQTESYEDTAVFRYPETDQSGLYRAVVGQHPREHLFAVNVPTATDAQQETESDLTRTNSGALADAFPNSTLQVVTDLRNINRTTSVGGTEVQQATTGIGAMIAHWLLLAFLVFLFVEVVLAWKLGHYSKSGEGTQAPADGALAPAIIGGVGAVLFIVIAGTLIHTAFTNDFLSFLPDSVRTAGESLLGVPAPVAGESTRWRLDYTPYLANRSMEPWVLGGLALAAVGFVLAIYLREGRTAGTSYRVLLAGLRIFVILLALFVLVPQLQLWFERQGWPDIAIILDDSQSMGVTDNYQDPRVKEAAAKLAQALDLPQPKRLQLAQALLANKDYDWLDELLTRRKFKLHIYRCSSSASRISDLTDADQYEKTAKEVQGLRPEGSESQLGKAVRTVLTDYRGSSLAGIVMFTDGVTTEGEDLSSVARHASQMGVPLFFVGIGDNHEVRDMILHDLQAEDSVFVNDRLVFEARLTAQGYVNHPPVTVKLFEKARDGSLKELAKEKVVPDPLGKPVKFRITHRPTEAGEKTYIIDLPVEPDESPPHSNNRLERTVLVREAKPARVLYIEGYPRYEYRFIKSLLEREAADEKGNKTIELKVLLLDADDDYPMQDKTARSEFPTKEELNQFEVVILGDVDPRHRKLGEKNLKLLVDFVRERGCGLLVQGGERFNPQAFKDTPLADVLPIQVVGSEPADGTRREPFRPLLTPVGRLHPIFRFHPDEAENTAIWNHLSEIFWHASGFRLQPAAEVLAVHPTKRTRMLAGLPDDRQPLIVQHFVGAGRCMFFGIDETWRWRFRQDELHFNQFWVQTVKYLARSGLGRIDLRLNRQTPYRKGEPIQVTVRFPDDSPAPPPENPVKVVVERRQPQGEVETETIQLQKLEGSRATYEAMKTRTPEGEYRFWLSSPTVTGVKPHAECKVIPPPGEMEKIRMNQAEMERAAEESRGKFYTLADAEHLLDDLPAGSRVSLNTPGPPWLLWNHFLMFALVLGLFGSEWIMRKRKHLL